MTERLRKYYPPAVKPSVDMNNVLEPLSERTPNGDEAHRRLKNLLDFKGANEVQRRLLETFLNALILNLREKNISSAEASGNIARHLERCLDAGISPNWVASLAKGYDQFEEALPPAPVQLQTPLKKEPKEAKSYKDFPKSKDGTPFFKQGDPKWGKTEMMEDSGITLHAEGCSVTALAMALSKLTRKLVTPKKLDELCDQQKCYVKNVGLDWGPAAAAFYVKAERVTTFERSDIRTIRNELAHNRPVVAAVEYVDSDGRRQRETWTPDHWITLTRVKYDKKHNTWHYWANDPATGKEIHLKEKNGKFISDEEIFGGHYFSVEKGYVLFQ